MPVPPANFAIPSSNHPALDESVVLICGIVPDTTAFVPTWTAPKGVSFTPDDLADSELGRKYMIQNGRLTSNFPQGSILTVMRLSYIDSGNYTCSVEFSDGMTGSAEFQLTLLGKYIQQLRVHYHGSPPNYKYSAGQDSWICKTYYTSQHEIWRDISRAEDE